MLRICLQKKVMQLFTIKPSTCKYMYFYCDFGQLTDLCQSMNWSVHWEHWFLLQYHCRLDLTDLLMSSLDCSISLFMTHFLPPPLRSAVPPGCHSLFMWCQTRCSLPPSPTSLKHTCMQASTLLYRARLICLRCTAYLCWQIRALQWWWEKKKHKLIWNHISQKPKWMYAGEKNEVQRRDCCYIDPFTTS